MRLLTTVLVAGIMANTPIAASDDWPMALAAYEKQHEMAAVTVYSLGPAGRERSAGVAGLDIHTPVRIASVTKIFTAATALRLMEDGKLDLLQPIAGYIDPAFSDILRADGYDPTLITVKHLMSHTSGMADHAQTRTYFDRIIADPGHGWTRTEILQGLVEWTDPAGVPGEKFEYSDTGYVLLGHIIERQSGLSLADAARRMLGFDAIGLPDTYWEIMERNDAAAARRAHQKLDGMDTHGWSATMDLYGGGGLVSSVHDMARFFQALFAGRVFKNPETLAIMLSGDGLPVGSPYRLGLFVRSEAGVDYYEHEGFWGTVVMHVPSTNSTFAGAVLDKTHFSFMRQSLLDAISAEK
jgi:D-alanyl-D-alanine carboxypeptidase